MHINSTAPGNVFLIDCVAQGRQAEPAKISLKSCECQYGKKGTVKN